MKKIIIAIDGYSACGKSTTAKVVASFLSYAYIDTGAMYRAVTLYFLDNYIDITNPKSVSDALSKIEIQFHRNTKNNQNEVFMNGLNVEKNIRDMRVSGKVSEVSALKKVRVAMVAQQQKMGKNKSIVMDGRDIGTVVFPQAELKIFMNADFDVRAERRQKELLEKGELIELDKIKENLAKRDHIDTTREESPLVKAENGIEIDTTHVTFDEQVEQIIHLAQHEMIKT
jgi:cytidylate kinase